MIRTGDEYRESIRDGREVWVNGERVADVPTHPMFKPLVDIRARIYDMAHEVATRDIMTTVDPEFWRALRRRSPVAADSGGLAGQAPRCRCGHGRHRRGRHPRRRRDGRRDVVALRRAGRAQRDRSHLLREHPPPRRCRGEARPLPRLGQHRSQRGPFQASPGAGPRHAPPRGEGDRRRDRRQRARSSRRRRPTPTRPSSNRPSPTGATASCRTTPSGSSPRWARPA